MPTIIENRRNLHQIPEIELTTQKTAQYIENVLDLYDCTIDHPIQNSVTAFFDNKKEKTIVFRSDMDALPMEENTNHKFNALPASRFPIQETIVAAIVSIPLG